MKTWEELVTLAKDMASAAGRKATDIADLAKLKLKLAENEKAVEATLTALGRLFYETRKGSQEPDEDMISELIAQMDELYATGEQLQAEIDVTRGRKTCADCGAANPEGAAYCNCCGKSL
ncbi:MAG: hypothetical protein II363_01525 [Clostridia bacterium]|nr:hypothetical protein [Clostridia bacterium]